MKTRFAFLLPLLVTVFAAPAHALPPVTEDGILRNFLWEEFISLPPGQRPKVGLALSAGGVRGFAHVGVLEVLHNAGVPVDVMAGTSMGAVVGSLYAAGVPTGRVWGIGTPIKISPLKPGFNLI